MVVHSISTIGVTQLMVALLAAGASVKKVMHIIKTWRTPFLLSLHNKFVICSLLSCRHSITVFAGCIPITYWTQSTPIPNVINFSAQGGYEIVTSGSTCERITTKANCEEAAKQLDLQPIDEYDWNTVAPYCNYEMKDGKYNGRLYFNSQFNSTAECGSEIFNCICKKGIFKHLWSD